MRAAQLLVVSILLVSATTARAGIIANGSFENPVVKVGLYENFLAGSTSITGWTVVGVDSTVVNSAFSQNGITFNAQDGNQYIDLAGISSNSRISGVTQAISTLIGEKYELSFYVGSATDNNAHFPSTVDLRIDGGARISFRNPNAPTNMLDWMLFTVPFTAQNATTTLTFLNGSESFDNGNVFNNYLSALDNVSVSKISAVPEPSSLAIFTVAFAVAGVARQIRRRTKR